MKLFYWSFIIGLSFGMIGIAISYQYTIEQEEQKDKQVIKWCHCINNSEQTDQELEDCDSRFDPDLQFEYDADCRQ